MRSGRGERGYEEWERGEGGGVMKSGRGEREEGL